MILQAPGTAEAYVSQVISLHVWMAAHWHVLMHGMPRSYRHLTRALRSALNALACRFDGSYPEGC